MPSFYKDGSLSFHFHHTRCLGTNFRRVPDGSSSLNLQYFSALIPPRLNAPGGNRRSARSVREVPEACPRGARSPPPAPLFVPPPQRGQEPGRTGTALGEPPERKGGWRAGRDGTEQRAARRTQPQPHTLPPPSPPLSGGHFKPSPPPRPRGGRFPSLSYYLLFFFPTR